MKKRSREINVFSVSALDLFASALGAFILLSLLFMVFFSMTASDPGQSEEALTALEQCRSQLAAAEARASAPEVQSAESFDAADLEDCESRMAQLEQMLAQCHSQLAASGGLMESLERANEELLACRRELQRTFVLVIASWSSSDDVDLHVVDPDGREFYYADKRIAGSEAALEEDNTQGPGNEVWLHPFAATGRYRVCYKLYRGAPSPTVRGSVLWQEGKVEIPDLRLTEEGQVRLAAEVVVDDDGIVSVDRTRSGQVLGTSGCR